MLIDAYRRYTTSPAPEPACVAEMVQTVIESADPRITKVMEFLDEFIDFNPVKTAEFKGRQYYAWITQKDLMDKLWTWYKDPANEDNREFGRTVDRSMNTKTKWKDVLSVTMRNKKRPLQMLNIPQGQLLSYNMVAFKATREESAVMEWPRV
jgi:hypothetical protein